jgi:alpha-beta hydrolase superfamily lysophospholipase
MKHNETYFEGAEGITLYSQNWLPEDITRAVIAIVHGIGEHSGRYMNVVDYMIPNQIAVYGYDLRGHGKSSDQRGHIDSWKQYRIDLLNFLIMIKSQQLECPIFLLGHSLGALIVLDLILTEPEELAGVITCGTPIEPVGSAKPHLVALARLLSSVYPRFSVDFGLDLNALSRDPAVVKAYKTDPLVHGKVSARWGTETLSTIESVKMQVEDINIPILILHGEADRIHTAEGTRKFFDQIQFHDKEIRVYPFGYHEVHNDLNYQEMLSDLLDWINRHIEDQSLPV